MIGFILRLFDLIAPLIRLLGADYAQFRAILEVKLILDNRRRTAGMQRHRDAKSSKPTNGLVLMLFSYTFMGVMVAWPVALAAPFVATAMLHTFIMVMVGLALIADFSTVLMDTTDNLILQPRPLTGRTILVARVAHTLVYLATLSFCLSAIPMVVGMVRIHVLFPLIFLPTLACSVAMVVAFVNALYLLVMRLVSGERLRDLLNYVQIAMVVVMIGAYQVIPRLMDPTTLWAFRIEDHRWLYALPSVWCAAPVEMLHGALDRPKMLLSLLAVAAPLAGMMLVAYVLAPRFGRALLKLDAERTELRPAGQAERRVTLGSRLSGWLCRTPAQRAAFELIWILCGRDRQFKARTYPSAAIALIMGLSFLMSQGNGQGFWDKLADVSHTRAHLYVLYVVGFMMLATLQHLRYSPQYEAAWVYYALPIARPGEVLLAALKAMVVRFITPMFAVAAVLVGVIWGWHIVGDLAVAFVALLFMSVLGASFWACRLPFSEAYGAMEGSGRFGLTMLLMVIPASLGGIHYACSFYWPALVGFLILLLGATWLLARRYGRISWYELHLAEE